MKTGRLGRALMVAVAAVGITAGGMFAGASTAAAAPVVASHEDSVRIIPQLRCHWVDQIVFDANGRYHFERVLVC